MKKCRHRSRRKLIRSTRFARSAAGIKSFIDAENYNCFIVTIVGQVWRVELSESGENTPSTGMISVSRSGAKKRYSILLTSHIHGTRAKTASCGIFRVAQYTYSTCNVLVSALTFNKFTCNQYLKVGIRVAESVLLRKASSISDEDSEKIGLPCFVNPTWAEALQGNESEGKN